ncbi:MAG: MBL fold metallo-hydrolase [Clostridia bacterium]|nr:MBL fold metallo-hydrolase [Clostridia bacterium]
MEDKVTVTSVANAGVMITYRGRKFLFDAIQTGNPYFSGPPDDVLSDLINSRGIFADAELLAYSHYHNDHIDFEKNLEYLSHHRPAHLVLPHDPFKRTTAFKLNLSALEIPFLEPNVPLDKKVVLKLADDVSLTCYHSRHDGGEKFDKVYHYTFLLSVGDKNILLAADSPIMDCRLYDDLKNEKIDLALFNLLFMNNKKGRQIINSIRPAKLVIYHVPLEGHPSVMFRKIALRDAERFKDEMPETIVFSNSLDSVEV